MSFENCLLWNAQSINNKINNFIQILEDNDINICCISETWLQTQNNTITAKLKESGYTIYHFNRISKRGGGVAILLKSNYKTKFEKSLKYVSFEGIIQTVITSSNSANLTVIVIYRHFSEPFTLFLEEFYQFVEYVKLNFKFFVMCGDFNVHVNKSTDSETMKFMDILDTFSLQQTVNSSTQKCGNILDLIITCDPECITISDIVVDSTDTLGSDHFPIYFKLYCNIEMPVREEISYRNVKKVDITKFCTDIITDTTKYLAESDGNDFKASINSFLNIYSSTLDRHAPVINKVVNTANRPPWMDSEFVAARKERRILYKKWKKERTDENRNNYVQSRAAVDVMASDKRRTFYQESIRSSKNSQKELFDICNNLLDRSKKSLLPYSEDYHYLASRFNKYFVEKIEKIRKNLDPPIYVQNVENRNISRFNTFKLITAEDLHKQINLSKIKTSQGDPIPAFLLRSSIHLLVPSLLHLVNTSLCNGSMEGLGESIVTPILKKSGLDQDLLSNYRPVCGGMYIDKLIQKNVLIQLDEHMDENDLHISYQSGYKPYHSCETVLLAIVNDILLNLDKGLCVVLLLLDLSAAFDTVDHEELLSILSNEIGLGGTVLDWFKSFLHGRTQATSVKGCKSEFANMKYGVPQGSVLGPKLFNIYIRNFIRLLRDAGFVVHGYADDHQVTTAFRIEFQYNKLCYALPKLLDLISKWMNSHFLKLNASKSNLLIFSPQNISDKVFIDNVYLGDNTYIPVSREAMNLGVKIDSQLSFSPQISMIIKQSYRYITEFGRIRKYLSVDDIQCLVQAIIVSRVDNCNCLLYGIPDYEISRLQRLQNSCARLIYGKRKHDHVSELFSELHWLPVKQRIIFKILLFIFKIFTGMCPQYLEDCVIIANPDTRILYIPRTNTAYGDRAFSNSAPRLWNALPIFLRKSETIHYFKAHLKHHLFSNFHEFSNEVNKYKTFV